MSARDDASGGIKTNAHIRADMGAFLDAFMRAQRALRGFDGVVGVGYGRKERGGRFTNALAIEVFVRDKKALTDIAPDQRVPPTFEGYRTDVRVVPAITLGAADDDGAPSTDPNCVDSTLHTTILGGIQIQARPKDSTTFGEDGAGTLGCIVRKRHRGDGDDNVYVLTCRHVLLGQGGTPPDIYLYQPWAPPPVDVPGFTQILGVVEDAGIAKEVSHQPPTRPFELACYIDCGVVRVDLGSTCFGKSCKKDRILFDTTINKLNGAMPGPINGVRDIIFDPHISLPPGDDVEDPPDPVTPTPWPDLTTATDENRVYKVGRSTGFTTGIVVCNYAAGINRFTGEVLHGVIEIAFDPASSTSGLNCRQRATFGVGGDSGSLVVDKDHNAVGLLFGGRNDTPGNPTAPHMIYASHIVPVLDNLRVCIPTSGPATHGSANATDGSGLATNFSNDQLLAGAWVGAEPVARERSTARRAGSAPDDSWPGITALGDALRATARGRAFAGAFSGVSREISYLIRNHRPVTVTWHRNRGPAFLACALRYARGEATSIPTEIEGITRLMLIERMRDTFNVHGSAELRHAIVQHGADILFLTEATTIEECLDALHQADSAETPA
ncbi:MAG: hypothetical protein ACREPM_06560 [Gemmatimonadaceae bacterium]